MQSGKQKQETKMVMVDLNGQLLYDLPFTPFSEWKQEEGCAVLVIDYLSGFTEGDIRVQLQNLDRLRVYGKRFVSVSTASFDETYLIPEDCTTRGMQTMFEDGSFYVMLQKKNNKTPVGFKRKLSKPAQQTPEPIKEVKDSTPLPKPSPSIRPNEQPREEASPPASTAGGGDGKPVEAPSKSQIDKENDRRQSISIITEAKPSEAPTKLNSPEDGETNINLGKASAPKSTTKALSSGKALSSKPEAKKVSEGQPENDIVEKDLITTPKLKEEERKLLVNIGVAALVIVALGAYVVTYSRWSST